MLANGCEQRVGAAHCASWWVLQNEEWGCRATGGCSRVSVPVRRAGGLWVL